ncbi:MAG TPA: GNAT family N-acetyltransferase [Propionibacteriaceae bacterium]|nr:GNAT family N-acetyltransferase [Propionibacteriaceae bacterium]
MPALTWPDPLPRHGPIGLRPFRRGDLELVAEFAADPYVPLIGTIPTPFSEAAGLAYLERQHQRLADGTGWSFAIAELATDRAVGGAGLWLHDAAPATAGYAVAASARGRGIARAALTALTEFAWSGAGLHTVELFIEPTNLASIAVAERCGYRRRELISEHTEIGGIRRDMLRWCATRPGG